MAGPLAPEKRVLPTLNPDGTRRWIRPRLFRGRFQRARMIVGWTLIALFVALPFIRVGGHPVVLLDVPNRQFHLFGRTFLPTDGVLLMLLLLSIFVGIILLSALFGRVWCGWGCPQTVYMEFLFRPIERLLEGDRFRQMKIDREGMNARRALKYAIYLVIAAVLGNVFLAYFVGVDTLAHWMGRSPLEHPAPFIVMAVTTGLVFFDFAYFREQMCTVICPYARLQSVLLDTRSLIIGYDERRGEPRGKKGTTTGDCVDCGACVQACPTGIDIREGLQLECIACAQCVDACDGIMDRLGRDRGLIRYTSQDALAGKARGKLLRPRTVLYPLILVGLVTGLVIAGGGDRKIADVTVLRGIGAPFVEQGDSVQNHVRIKIRNRTSKERHFTVSLRDQDKMKMTLIAPENPLRVAPGEQETSSVFVLAPRSSFRHGARDVRFEITDETGFSKEMPYRLLGPTQRSDS